MGQDELIALTAAGMASSSLKGDLSEASLCPSRDPNLKPRESPLAAVIAMKQPLGTPNYVLDQGSWTKPLNCL